MRQNIREQGPVSYTHLDENQGHYYQCVVSDEDCNNITFMLESNVNVFIFDNEDVYKRQGYNNLKPNRNQNKWADTLAQTVDKEDISSLSLIHISNPILTPFVLPLR